MPEILETEYEKAIRTKLGVKQSELSDDDINQPMVLDMAEAVVKKRVPEYATITEPTDKLFLQNAVVSYICYLLCPSMTNRVKHKVATLDVKWEKSKVDWAEKSLEYLSDFEEALTNIETVEVGVLAYSLFGIASADGEGNE